MKKLILTYICYTLLYLVYILTVPTDEEQTKQRVQIEEQTGDELVTRVAVVPRNTTQAIAPKMGEE